MQKICCLALSLFNCVQVDRETSKEVVDGKLGKPHFCSPKVAFDHVHRLTQKVELLSTQTHQNKELDYFKENAVPKTKIVELERKMDMALTRMNVLESERESEGVISMKTLLQEMQRTIGSQNRKIEGQACDVAQLTKKLESSSKGPSNRGLTREDFPRTAGFSTQEEHTSEPSYTDSKML